MRHAVAIVAGLAAAALGAALGGGCAPADPTPNRAPPAAADYPPGPYGYATGSVIADLTFLGKTAPAPTDYSTLPMQAIALSSLRGGDTRLLVIDLAARWCNDCNMDEPAVKQLESDYAGRGVTVLEVLSQGGYGISATEDDINRWAAAWGLSGPIAIDPAEQLQLYADVDAYPVYLVVRASTMTIEYMKAQPMAAAPLGPVLDALLGQ